MIRAVPCASCQHRFPPQDVCTDNAAHDRSARSPAPKSGLALPFQAPPQAGSANRSALTDHPAKRPEISRDWEVPTSDCECSTARRRRSCLRAGSPNACQPNPTDRSSDQYQGIAAPSPAMPGRVRRISRQDRCFDQRVPVACSSTPKKSNRAFDRHLLDLGNRLGRVQPLGANIRAIHDRMATIEAERIL